MSKNCLNCGCEISGEGKNKIFCDECLLKISPFLKFVSKSPTSAVKLFELNSPKLRAQGLSEDAIRYIEKCCTRYDEKHAASAAAAAAAATAAHNAPIHNESAHINENEPTGTSVSEASEVDASIFGAVNMNEGEEDESSNTANIEMNILAALGGAAAMGSIGNDDAAAAAASAAAQTGGISLEGLDPDNAISGSLNTRETAAVSAGAAAASHAASHTASRTGSGGSGGGGKPPHNEDDFDDGDTQQSDDKKRVYIILVVAAIALVLFLIIFIASSDRENGDSETTTDADNTLISTDESSYDSGDVSTDEGTYTDGTSADGTSDDGTSADESTSEDESTSADENTSDENTSGEVTTAEAEATTTTADETTTAAPEESTANATTYYTVSFNLNYTGATGTPASQEVESGSTAATPTSPTRTGYTFLGWYTSRTGNTEYSFSSAVTANITLYAHWSADTYTVTFNSNGGSSVSSQTVSYGSSATKPTDPTRDGYTFLGWYTSSTGGTEYSFSSSVTSSFTLYAHWAEQTAATYTVSFDMNYPSGFSGASNVPSSQTVEEGSTATEPTAPTLEGCTFLGWYLRDGTKYSFSTAVTENITLYASWDVSTFTVSFNLNYENATGVWTTETVNYGSTATEPTTPTRDGYTFLGWYTINGAKYDFTSSVTSNITLYAQWEEIIETYTVTFRWNYENDPGVYLTTTVEEGSTVSEPTDPTRSGHTFLGWYTASGTLYDFSTPVTGNLVLYAQWS